MGIHFHLTVWFGYIRYLNRVLRLAHPRLHVHLSLLPRHALHAPLRAVSDRAYGFPALQSSPRLPGAQVPHPPPQSKLWLHDRGRNLFILLLMMPYMLHKRTIKSWATSPHPTNTATTSPHPPSPPHPIHHHHRYLTHHQNSRFKKCICHIHILYRLCSEMKTMCKIMCKRILQITQIGGIRIRIFTIFTMKKTNRNEK